MALTADEKTILHMAQVAGYFNGTAFPSPPATPASIALPGTMLDEQVRVILRRYQADTKATWTTQLNLMQKKLTALSALVITTALPISPPEDENNPK